MNLGVVGLGKMGYNLSLNLIDQSHEVTVYDINQKAVEELSDKGAVGTASISEFIDRLSSPKVIWMMGTGRSNYRSSALRAQNLFTRRGYSN
jgi:6-phosphogluconate dehydrogenase